MRKLKSILLYCLFALLGPISGYAQTSTSKNLGFELGNFTNWVGYSWLYSTDVSSINTSQVKGIVSRRHTIISDTSAYDANTGNALKKIPSGYLYSARLGDEITSADSNPRCWEQSLRYTLKVDSTNVLLIMRFALVLQYATDHTAKVEPRFRLTLFAQNGDTIPDCANYDVYSSSSNVKGFHSYTLASTSSSPGGGSSVVEWRDWTSVGANLSKYIGQTITIEFMSADCTGRYHFGYAYFVAASHPLNITMKYCAGDTAASLTAPDGFESYSWTNSNGTVIDTSKMLTIDKPIEGAVYTCTMVSATGCTVSLQSTVANYVPKAEFSTYMIDCNSNTVQFTNLSTLTHGTLSYEWDFGDGGTSTLKNPQYTFTTSGMHLVSLNLSNPPSTCVDTLVKEVESFSPPLVGIKGDTTYCPNLSTYLKAYGAYGYAWSTGSSADSIEISAPGGTYWMVGNSSTGCTSDTIFRTVTEEPDWTFLTEGDTSFCAGQSSILSASGAVNYWWSTGDSTNSITVTTTGTYISTGANKRGCEKSRTFNAIAHPLPDVDFTLSTNSISSKHNQITGHIPSQTDVQYLWNLGDGSTDTGSEIQHSYSISSSILGYVIVLTATNSFNCADSATKTIDVIPFVPNVFSPNGDGVNDLFLPDISLQVIDRNGLLIYKGTTGWNGKWNGRLADPDTYFYLVDYRDMNGKEHTKKGYITLVR